MVKDLKIIRKKFAIMSREQNLEDKISNCLKDLKSKTKKQEKKAMTNQRKNVNNCASETSESKDLGQIANEDEMMLFWDNYLF